MNIQLKAKRQDGFTIIELVVVILLLGILAATALPRFLDVTDEAHEAAVQGVLGGVSTGSALFRANWVASGQAVDAVNTDFGDGTLFANEFGYPVGTGDATLDASSCGQIFSGLLQGGSPNIASAAAGFDRDGTSGDPEATIETATALPANADAQWIALTTFDTSVTSGNTVANADQCRFYYVGQYRSGGASPDDETIPVITLNITNGNVTTGTQALDGA